MAVAADPAALAVVGHQDHGRVLELSPALEEREELPHPPVGLGQLVEVLRAPHAPHVAELVGGEQLEHEQLGVLLVDHPARLGCERAIDFRGRLHRCHRPDHFFTERVEQMRDPHEPAAAAVALEDVEDRLPAHAEPRREVRPHAVLGRRRAGEHRREADDRPRRIGRLDIQILGALPGEPVDDRGIRLPEPPPVAAVDDDHVHAPGERRPRVDRRPPERGERGPLALGIARQAPPECAAGQHAEDGRCRQAGRQPGDRRSGRLLRQQGRGAHGDQQLRELFERVSARRVGVRQHQAPEAQPVGPGRACAEVVVERPPDDHREERIARERAGDQPGRPPRLEQRHGEERGEPQEFASAQRECEARQNKRRRRSSEHRQPERSVGGEPHRGRREQHEQGICDRERPALVEDVPGTRRPDLGEASRALVPRARARLPARREPCSPLVLAGHARHRIRVP